MEKKQVLAILLFIFLNTNFCWATRRKGFLGDPDVNSLYEVPWKGKWFPGPPSLTKAETEPHSQEENIQNDSVIDKNCDGIKELVNIDFDPADKRHSYNYLCVSSKKHEYAPDLQREAILVEHFIPLAYEPPVKCMNETIDYVEKPPTYGAYRPWPPQYGSYKYLPPQRWLHSLAEGAIVMLYHPCAFPGQVRELEKIVKSCLYRHIISPSQDLSPDRPLALMAWGKYLKLSVVDERMVVNFIKKNAKQGINRGNESSLKPKTNFYVAGLLEEAHLVTDINDSEICGYKEM